MTDKAKERAVIGALRSAINDHGPITPDKINSAMKRVLGNLANVSAEPVQLGALETMRPQSRALMVETRGLLAQALGEMDNDPRYAVSLRADMRAMLAKLDEALK